MTEQDVEIAIHKIKERRKLLERLSGLTNSAIARDLEVSRREVEALDRETACREH